MKKFRLLAVGSNNFCAGSFYRGNIPLIELRRELPQLELTCLWDLPQSSFHTLREFDGVFVWNPSVPPHLDLIATAKQMRMPIWTDIDDFIFAMPDSNPFKQQKIMAGVFGVAEKCFQMSDFLTVSTPELAKQMAPFNQNISVIENAFNDALLGPLKPKLPPAKARRKTLAWRGGSSHWEDIQKVCGSLEDFYGTYPEWGVLTIGDIPYPLIDGIPLDNPKRFCSLPWSSVVEYFVNLSKIQPRVLIVPLHDSVFNRCKSNVAWQEAMFANSLVIAPDWAEWRRPGVLSYTGPDDFQRALTQVVEHCSDAEFDAQVTAGWECVPKLSQVNLKRARILQQMGMV